MGFPLATQLRQTPMLHSARLAQAIRHLDEIADNMADGGFEEETRSLRTTIGDLQWQYEELIDKELVAQWPNGPRRPLRAMPQIRDHLVG